MLRHIVLYRLSPELGAQAVERIDALIRSLPSKVPGVLELQVGPNVGPPDFTGGYDWGFCMRFADRDGRDDFMKHAFHLRVADQVEELIDDLVVLDLEQ
jgi:Stress responsive A/B Barrel Domain